MPIGDFYLTDLEVDVETRQVYVTPEALRRVLTEKRRAKKGAENGQ
jgi:hypothetical protein